MIPLPELAAKLISLEKYFEDFSVNTRKTVFEISP